MEPPQAGSSSGSSGNRKPRIRQKCAMPDCKSHLEQDKEVRTFAFPKDPEVCAKWMKFAGIDPEKSLKNIRMCSLHFSKSAFKEDWIIDLLGYPIGGMKIKKDAVPTIREREEQEEIEEKEEKEVVPEEFYLETSEDPEDPLSANHMPQETEESQGIPDPPRIELVALESEEPECILFRNPEINRHGHIKYSSSTQTHSRDPELEEAKQELEAILREVEDVQREKVQLEAKISRYRVCFNPSQRRMVEEATGGFVHWPPRDIAAALSLYKMGPNAYRYLKEQKNYPLPTIRTLQMWVKNFKKKTKKAEESKEQEPAEEQMDVDDASDTDTEDL